MATIVNTPAQSDSGNGLGFLVGMILLVGLVLAFLYYGLPMMRQSSQQPSIQVPDTVDVNINQPPNPAPAQ